MRYLTSRPWLPAVFCAAIAASSCGSEPAPASSTASSAPQPPAQAAAPAPPLPTIETAQISAARQPYLGPLPPLPVADYPAPRPPEVVQAVYEYAARHPEVLRYIPCFCGCERNGHKGNDDCFVAGRDATGRPRWDSHGMT